MNEQQLINLLENHREYAALISILINCLFTIVGFLPTVIVAAVNVVVFGPVNGFLISFIGELVGAITAFFLYRKGFQSFSREKLVRYPKLMKLLDVKGKDAFLLIVLLRAIPVVPSALITLAASIGQVSFLVFLVSTIVGKLPGILIKTFSIYQVVQLTLVGKLMIVCVLLYGMGYGWNMYIKNKAKSKK